jgi:NAD(P)-dependent dehydrogenase (short-subunit alcohol dehydrogenase family)
MENSKVWFITGASKGLGLSLVKKLLQQGYRVAATSRKKESLEKEIGANDNFLPLEVNLADVTSVEKAVKSTHSKFGSINVVVNNAGYGIGGAVEELNKKEIDDSFSINLFAVINVSNAVLPYMRAQRSGRIINISSIAGFAPAIGWALYAAAKYAVVGLSEVMAQDVQELGIKVTVVLPGGFRTSFLSNDSLVLSQNKINDYKEVHATHQRYLGFHGLQIGDPEKAADVFIKLAEHPNPPVRLFMGSDAYSRAQQKLDSIVKDMESWKELTMETDFK